MIATAERVTQRFHPVSAPDYLPAHLLRDLQLGRLQATVRPYGLFACPLSEVVRLHASSGTTGKPIVVAYTQDDLNVWTSVMARALSREDKPVPNATVVLLPAEPNRRFPTRFAPLRPTMRAMSRSRMFRRATTSRSPGKRLRTASGSMPISSPRRRRLAGYRSGRRPKSRWN